MQFPGNPQTTPARRAGSLTADPPLPLCPSKSSSRVSPPALWQTGCFGLPLSHLHPSAVHHADFLLQHPSPIILLSELPTPAAVPGNPSAKHARKVSRPTKQVDQLLLFTLPAPPKPVPGPHPQLCRLPPVISLHSPTPFLGTKQMSVEHLAFLPSLDTSVPSSKSIPIPMYQLPIHRKTF